jgi:hypothetical protein
MAIYRWVSADHFLSVYVLLPSRANALLLGVLCAMIVRSDIAMTVLIRRRGFIVTLAIVQAIAVGKVDPTWRVARCDG